VLGSDIPHGNAFDKTPAFTVLIAVENRHAHLITRTMHNLKGHQSFP